MPLLFPVPGALADAAWFVGASWIKTAGKPELSYGLAGRLYLARSGWLLLSVPNALLRGAFEALQEPGVELPYHSDGTLSAHISVMRPEELEQIGGGDKITERGKLFHYTLGPAQSVVPAGWGAMSRVWMIKVHSPELKKLRVSYGLPPLPNNNQFEFHITFAVRRKGVLQANATSKAAA